MALLQGLELLEGERVDRTHDPQLAFEIAHPRRRRDPLRQLGALGGHRLCRLLVEITAQSFDRGFDPQLGLGILELDPLQSLAQLTEMLLGLGSLASQRIELGRNGTSRLGLAPAPLAQIDEDGVDLGRAFGHESHEAFGGNLLDVQLYPAVGGGRSLGGRAFETLLELGQAPAQELTAFVDRGGADLDVGPQGANLGRPFLDVSAGLTHAPATLDRLGLGVLEAGQHLLELDHPSLLTGNPLAELIEMRLQGGGLAHGVPSIGLDSLESVTGGAQATVVVVERPTELGFDPAGIVDRGTGFGESGRRLLYGEGGLLSSSFGFLESRTRSTRRR